MTSQEEEIYLLVVGPDPFGKIRFHTGQKVEVPTKEGKREVTIHKIIEDKNSYFLYGSVRYTIFALDEEGEVFKFRDFIGPLQLHITYGVPPVKAR